jgi:hypothetical protein
MAVKMLPNITNSAKLSFLCSGWLQWHKACNYLFLTNLQIHITLSNILLSYEYKLYLFTIDKTSYLFILIKLAHNPIDKKEVMRSAGKLRLNNTIALYVTLC